MATSTEQKMCFKCEELIHPYAVSCPYCGAEQHRPKEGSGDQSLTPPYQLVTPQPQQETSFQSPYAGAKESTPPPPPKPAAQEPQPETVSQTEVDEGHLKPVLLPMVLLLSGTVSFLFGLVLLLFSQDGILTLKWNGTLWPLYLLGSLPLLGWGWRALHNVSDEI